MVRHCSSNAGHEDIDCLVTCKRGIPGQVALNDPAQNPHLGNALNDPTPGKRVHSMTPSLKKIFPRHKKN